MIRNQLYPYIEQYINEYLHGFTKEQLEIGLMKGQIELEMLNLRPDKLNQIMDNQNQPFWIKAGLLRKISVKASILNILGEIPLEILVDGIDVIVTPSYKWILKTTTAHKADDASSLREKYSPSQNNSIDIFKRKIQLVDDSVLQPSSSPRIYTDGTAISGGLNGLYGGLYKFHYMSNFAANVKIKNIHVRVEDDQLINYVGDLALGVKIGAIEVTLGCEGAMKKDSFKLSGFDVYWESQPKILIPSSVLNNSIHNGRLLESYYANLKKIKFQEFAYRKNTQFIVKNFALKGNFGTKANVPKEHMDIFASKENSYKMYVQFATGELTVNVWPELLIVMNTFTKFLNQYKLIEQVQSYKPAKRPFNKSSPGGKELLGQIQGGKNATLAKNLAEKRRMIVRDWLYYFYWCKRGSETVSAKAATPLRMEFNRYYKICILKDTKPRQENDSALLVSRANVAVAEEKKDNAPTAQNPNPDNVKINFICEFLVKSVNITLHPSLASAVGDCCFLNLVGFEIRTNISEVTCDVNINLKHINFGPNNLVVGQRLLLSQNSVRKNEDGLNKSTILNSLEQSQMITGEDVSNNIGLGGLLKKYSPNYEKKLRFIDNALDNASSLNQSEYINRDVSPPRFDLNADKITLKTRSKFIPTPGLTYGRDTNLLRSNANMTSNNSSLSKGYLTRSSAVNTLAPRGFSFAKNIINNFEPTPLVHKNEINRQKIDFSISQTISDFNNRRKQQRANNAFNQTAGGKLRAAKKLVSSQVMGKGEAEPLHLFEAYSNAGKNTVGIKFFKNNSKGGIDTVIVKMGTFRLTLFADYVSRCLSVLKDYQAKSQYKTIGISVGGAKLEKKLYEMRTHMHAHISKQKQGGCIFDYMNYLEKQLEEARKKGIDSENYQINYIFSFFPKGIELYVDYDNFECIYYNADNKVCGHAVAPPLELLLKLDPSKIKIKFFGMDLEINDLDNTKNLLAKLLKIMEEKMKMQKIFIEPCLTQLKADMKYNKENYEALEGFSNAIENKQKELYDNFNIVEKSPMDRGQNLPQNQYRNAQGEQNFYQNAYPKTNKSKK